MDTLFFLIFLMLCLGLAGWLFFLWAVKSGQYDDVEGPKYRMLDDDEEEKPKTPEETHE
jgi:cbb3-type cytochrome oxidase maturation protein